MDHPDITITVSGKAGTGVLTLAELIANALSWEHIPFTHTGQDSDRPGRADGDLAAQLTRLRISGATVHLKEEQEPRR